MHVPDSAMMTQARQEAAVCAERLRLPLRRMVWRGGSGELAGAGSGSSLDFQDHRNYLAGDDPRHINWAAYARTGLYTMKLFREEVSPTVEILLDVSPSMFLDEAKARLVCALFSFSVEAARRDTATTVLHLLDGAKHRLIPAEEYDTGAWLQHLDPDTPHADPPPPPAMDLIPLRSASLRLWISDLLFPVPPSGILRALSRQRGHGMMFVPYCAAEAAPDWQGICDFHDVEAGRVETRDVDDGLKKRYLASYRAHFSAWKEEATRHQMPLARISADAPLARALTAEGLFAHALEPAS